MKKILHWFWQVWMECNYPDVCWKHKLIKEHGLWCAACLYESTNKQNKLYEKYGIEKKWNQPEN